MEQKKSALDILESLSDEEIKALSEEDLDNLQRFAEEELEELKLKNKRITKDSILGPATTFGATLADTALLGYGPNILAASGAMQRSPYLSGLEDPYLSGLEDEERLEYTKTRDELTRLLERNQAENPLSATAGKVAGAITSMAIPGLAGIRALRGLGKYGSKIPLRIGAAGAEATAVSALENPGNVEGQVGGLQLEERKNRAIETATSPLTWAMSSLAGISPRRYKTKEEATNPVKRILEKDEIRALSILEPTPGNIAYTISKAKESPQSANSISKFLKNYRIGVMGDTYEDILSKSQRVKENLGNQISEIYAQNDGKIQKVAKDFLSQADNKKGLWSQKNPELYKALTEFSSERFYSELRKDFANSIKTAPDREQVLKYFDNYVNIMKEISTKTDPSTGLSFLSKPSLKELQDIRQSLDSHISTFTNNLNSLDVKSAEKAYNYLRNKVNNAIDNELTALEKILGNDVGKRLRDLNKSYSTASTVVGMAEESFSRDLSRKSRVRYFPMMALEALTPSKGTAESIKAGVGGVTDFVGDVGKFTIPQGLEKAARTGEILTKEPDIRMTDYEKVSPKEIPLVEEEIRLMDLGNIETAKRLNLLKKYNLRKRD